MEDDNEELTNLNIDSKINIDTIYASNNNNYLKQKSPYNNSSL